VHKQTPGHTRRDRPKTVADEAADIASGVEDGRPRGDHDRRGPDHGHPFTMTDLPDAPFPARGRTVVHIGRRLIFMAQTLDDAAVRAALSTLDGWTGDTAGLHWSVKLPDFPTAIAVVDEVAGVAEGMDHHPDIDIRWRTLTFSCVTHSAGGVTDNDVRLAGQIRQIATGKGGH
jgi:4a-hydroxytetrahydrobiopterin dehydratase